MQDEKLFSRDGGIWVTYIRWLRRSHKSHRPDVEFDAQRVRLLGKFWVATWRKTRIMNFNLRGLEQWEKNEAFHEPCSRVPEDGLFSLRVHAAADHLQLITKESLRSRDRLTTDQLLLR